MNAVEEMFARIEEREAMHQKFEDFVRRYLWTRGGASDGEKGFQFHVLTPGSHLFTRFKITEDEDWAEVEIVFDDGTPPLTLATGLVHGEDNRPRYEKLIDRLRKYIDPLTRYHSKEERHGLPGGSVLS